MLERLHGGAAEFHARAFPDPPRPAVWWFEVDRPAVVLGSRQRVEVLDRGACEREGLEIARRRSGGGIVLLVPGEVTWVDVLVPAGGDGWSDDVRAAMCWLGERWAAALAAVGVASGLTVHRGGLEGGAWGELVCFGGTGPGEVVLDGRKLVGISQRRTRDGARFQCAVHHRFDGDRTAGVLAGPRPIEPLPPVGVLPGVDAAALVAALVAVLGRSAPT